MGERGGTGGTGSRCQETVKRIDAIPHKLSHLGDGSVRRSRHQTEDPALVLHQPPSARLTLCVRNNGRVPGGGWAVSGGARI